MNQLLMTSLLSALSFSAIADTAGFVTLTTDKPNYVVGETAKAEVLGIGVCKNFDIDWGDGVKSHVAQFDFGPNGTNIYQASTHVYNQAKPYTITVSSTQCGTRTKNIGVTPAPTAPAGFVTLTTDKPNYVVGETAKAEVLGIGVCKNFDIDWGDGNKSHVAQFDFGSNGNNIYQGSTHQYTQAKIYTITVASAQCGSRSRNIGVTPASTAPAANPPAPTTTPVITPGGPNQTGRPALTPSPTPSRTSK